MSRTIRNPVVRRVWIDRRAARLGAHPRFSLIEQARLRQVLEDFAPRLMGATDEVGR